MHREVLTDDTAFLFLFIRIIFWLQGKFSLLFQLEYFLEQLIDIYIVFGGRFQVSNFPHFLQKCNIRHLNIQQTCDPTSSASPVLVETWRLPASSSHLLPTSSTGQPSRLPFTCTTSQPL